MQEPLEKPLVEAELPHSQEQPTLQLTDRPQTTIQGVTLVKMEPVDDPEAFLLAFESAATGALWPKEQWAMRLAPFLSEEAYAIYQALPFYTAEDYDQLKEAILDHMSMIEESYRKRFRSLTFTVGAKPRTVAHQLRDLGRKWLKPEIRSPEEIVERIIIEQFIKILPARAGEWLSRQHVRTLDRAVQLVEGYLAGEAIGRASRVGPSKVWPPSWDGAQQAEGIAVLKAEVPAKVVEAGELPAQYVLDAPDTGGIGSSAKGSVMVKHEAIPWSEVGEGPSAWDHQDSEERWRSPSSSSGFVTVKPEPFPWPEEGHEMTFGEYESLQAKEGAGRFSTEVGLMQKYKELNREQWTGIHEPQESLLLKAKEKVMQGSDQVAELTKWTRCPRKERGQTRNKMEQFIEYENGVINLASSTNQNMSPTGNKSYTCTECGKSFSHAKYLNSHQQIHRGDKPYKCDECGKSFRESRKLITHQRVHTGERPFTCTDCGKGFSQVAHLSSHKRMHTGEKPYTCNECGNHFGHLSTLISHVLIHTGEKPYKCSECGKGFRRLTDKRRHERTHTGEKPYKCSECGKSFNQSGSLYTHHRIHSIERITI